MALIDHPHLLHADDELHIDHFGLSVGSMSVGLPMSCTGDMILLRYLDLVRILGRPVHPMGGYPAGDIVALASATNSTPDGVECRLRHLGG